MNRKAVMLVLWTCIALLTGARAAYATPASHILRIDPRAGLASGQPELTTVIEIVEFKPMSDVLGACSNVAGGDPQLDCISQQMETPGKTYTSYKFPGDNAKLLVNVNGEDIPAKFGSATLWAQAKKDPGVGTAWLVAVDASSGMGARYREAQQVAHEFIAAMGPNDLMDLIVFDDRPNVFVADSKWKTFAQRNDLVKVLTEHPNNSPSHGRDRPLFTEIKQMTQDAFGSLGNVSGPQQIPLHQAMVVLSNGAGRGDPASASPSAEVFHQYLNKGRFPEDNTALPKTPLPVVSIWFPTGAGLVNDMYRNNDAQFMQSLANPEIGGYFDIVRAGQGDAKGKAILAVVSKRFDEMWIVKWRVSCLQPALLQTFNLVFMNTATTIAPDGTFKDVPIGIDPSQWPLDIDINRTRAEADANPIYPGGKMRIYGDFCWAGDKGRAEAYFVPAGTKPNPQAANSQDPSLAKKAMETLIQQGMRGGAIDASDVSATFEVPDDDKVLEGSGDNAVARVVIYDNKAKRGSGHDEKTVLTLKAQKKPFNVLFIAGIVGLLVVIVLLVMVLMRGGGGGGGGKKARTPPPQPVVAGGYGAPPAGPGYGGPPPGGGYGAPGGGAGGGAGGGQYNLSPAQGAQGPPGFTPHAETRGAAAPIDVSPVAAGGAPGGGAPSVVQVKCPSCGMPTMVTPGQASVCFSCGQPLPANIAGGGGAGAAPTFPLTGAMSAQPLRPPDNPYGAPSGSSATIIGAPGEFSIRPGAEIRVGRDPAQCAVCIHEPRVSGVHGTLKFEAARLWVRDETSNNGTYVDNQRISPGQWVPINAGSHLRFGPIEFAVRVE